MLGWGLEEAFGNTSAPLFCPQVLRRQHAHVQVLQPPSWVLINTCPAGFLPGGEHSGEEGIYQPSFFFFFFLLYNGCTLKTALGWTSHCGSPQLMQPSS